MKKRLKSSAIALVAIVALSVVAAPAAQAEEFTAGEYPATVFGAQESKFVHTFVTSQWKFTCEETTFSGELKAASSTMTLTPSFAKCGAELKNFPAFYAATINTNGCTFVFHDGKRDSETLVTGSMSVSCPAGKRIELSIYEVEMGKSHSKAPLLCTLGIPTQGPIAGLSFTGGGTAGFRVETEVAKMTVEKVTGSVATCGGLALGGTYSGATTLTAKNSKGETNKLNP